MYNVSEHACATEAAVERLFSTEAITHDKIKNRLRAATVEGVLKVRWNLEPVGKLAHRLQLGGRQDFGHVYNNGSGAALGALPNHPDNDRTDSDEEDV